MGFLQWLHDNAVITWIHESDSLGGYTLYLAFHTIGMVFLVGPSLLIGARVLGLAPELPLQPLARFRPVMTAGLWITLVTGLVLFATDGPNYVTNGVFITKIAALLVGVVCLAAMLRELFEREPHAAEPSPRAKALTAATLLMWTIGVVAGRLTAYSGVVVLASVVAFLILVAVLAAVGATARLLSHRRGESAPAVPMNIHPTVAKGGK